MNNILTITKYTLREAFTRKIFITFFAVSTLILIAASLTAVYASVEDLMPMVQQNGEQVDMMAMLVSSVKVLIVAPLFGLGLFLSIFSASSFIPNMLEKGNIDLLLSKPVSRNQIIWGKFFGGTIIVLLNIAYLVLGIWLLIGLKFGVWGGYFLLTIPSITFTFAVLYSLMILIGILTQSSILAMMISYLIFVILSPVLVNRENIAMLFDNAFFARLLDFFYYITPQTTELGDITTKLAEGLPITEYQPIITSVLFMILTLAASIIIFSKKDY